MACLITTGITKSCGYLVGGVTEIYLTNWSEVSGATSSSVTWKGGATQPKFFKIEPEKNTGSFIDELVVNNGQKSRNHSVTFQVNKKDQNTLDIVDEIALGNFVAIVKDRNGVNFLLGKTNGMEATVASVSSGAAETDVAGLQITLAGLQVETSFVYTGTITT